jgi:hypothetical protein
MSAYDEVYAALIASEAVTDLVPAARIQRFYVRDDVANPSIAYRLSSMGYHETIHGHSEGADATFEITAISESESEIEALASALELVTGLRPIAREDMGDPESQLFATIITVELLTTF